MASHIGECSCIPPASTPTLYIHHPYPSRRFPDRYALTAMDAMASLNVPASKMQYLLRTQCLLWSGIDDDTASKYSFGSPSFFIKLRQVCATAHAYPASTPYPYRHTHAHCNDNTTGSSVCMPRAYWLHVVKTCNQAVDADPRRDPRGHQVLCGAGGLACGYDPSPISI